MMDQRVDQPEIVGRDDPLAMMGGKALGDQASVFGLVEIRHVEADRAGFHRGAARLGHQCDDAGAIHPAGQEGAQRHVGDHARAHRHADIVGELRFQIAHRPLGVGGEDDIPPASRLGQRMLAMERQVMPRRQLADARDDASVVGHIAEAHEILDRRQVRRAA